MPLIQFWVFLSVELLEIKNRYMKKVLLVFAIASLPLLSASAQGIGIGLKGGLNFANQDISSVTQDISSRTGFHVGAYAHVNIIGGFGIQPEILYSSQGSEWVDNAGAGFDIKNKFSYLNIPVLLRFNVAMFNVHVGPQFGILTSAELDVNGAATDIKDQFTSGDFSIAAGVGVDLPFDLNATVRYVAGLSDISTEPDTIGEVKNATVQVSLGYRLIGSK
jgi:hypothetical protein